MKDDDKYLIFDSASCYPAGIDHKLSTLKCAIEEAILLDRVLVLRKFAIWPHQNFVYEQNAQTGLTDSIISNMKAHQAFRKEVNNIKFERYINLAKTKIYRIKNNGIIREIDKPLRYIDEDDFDLSAYIGNPKLATETDKPIGESPTKLAIPLNPQVLIMENNKLLPEECNQYKVVVRRTNGYSYGHSKNGLLVSFCLSDTVEQLTDKILRSIGTELDSVKQRYTFYCNATDSDMQNNYRSEFARNPLYYACLHVRANDLYYYPSIRYGTDPRNLKRIVERAVPKGSTLYVMSDINNPRYFDFLKKNYTVYRYFDFAELRSLVSGTNKEQIDNAMLYSVEKNILQYAHIKIVRAKSSPKLIYTDSTHEIPWRYRLPSIYEYLTTDILNRDPTYRNSLRKTIRHIQVALKSNSSRH